LPTNTQNSIDAKYEAMFKTYFTSLCYFAGKYIRDTDSCKEVVHKVFVNIWENRDTFDFEKSPKSYLFTSVYNRSMNHIRDLRKNESTDNEAVLNIEQLNSDHLQEAELEDKIWTVINSLPEKCREVFILNRFEEKKYAEIAEILGISIKTVETHISKALKVLRQNLQAYIHILILFIVKVFQ
jgi:RNA polymerase sigma-70 factor (ECF subfamily)